MIRVAVTGAKGRMGSTVVAAVTGAPDMEVVAQLDAGDPITKKTVNGAQGAVDFSLPSVTEANVHALLDAGVDGVPRYERGYRYGREQGDASDFPAVGREHSYPRHDPLQHLHRRHRASAVGGERVGGRRRGHRHRLRHR